MLTKPSSKSSSDRASKQDAGRGEIEVRLRHYCRNPRCRSKLPMPTVSPHKAFCCRGCYGSFYLKRCVVCENDKPGEPSARRVLRRRSKCRSQYRRNGSFFTYPVPSTVGGAERAKSAQSTGTKTGHESDRPYLIVAGPIITANAYHCAAIALDPDTRRRTDAANDRDRIRRETAWGRKRADGRLVAGVPSQWKPCPCDHVDLPIPDLLRRVP